ncbi:MAG: S41 family peptidase [Paludibacter sp.]
MKRVLFFLCVSLFFVSCKDDVKGPSEDDKMSMYVNEWLYQNMSELYYWNTTLPAYASSSANPSDYFVSLKNKADRFSAIFASYNDILNELNGVSTADIGFDFQLYKENSYNNNVLGIVEYVKHGTPAEKQGIKRGDIFRRINGTQITILNYKEVINYLYDKSASSTITFALVANNSLYDQTAVTVNKAANYQEDPVYMDTVYTVQNKKVGYLVYNFFTNDPGDGSMKYDLELNSVFQNFKTQNVSELIIDLRYNHGGMMSSAVHLSSMLVPNLTTNKVFAYTEFNQNYTDYFNSSSFKSQYSENPFVTNFSTTIDAASPSTVKTPIQNIGNNLQRIFFLVGNGTASASEMVINGLSPFLPVVLIGDTTVGKNVGSTLVNDTKNTNNQWAFMPIILKYFNKDHLSDFTQGFVPNFLVQDDYSNQLGNTNEDLLGKAISQISGLQGAPKPARVKRALLKSSLDFKLNTNGLVVNNKFMDSYSNRSRK